VKVKAKFVGDKKLRKGLKKLWRGLQAPPIFMPMKNTIMPAH